MNHKESISQSLVKQSCGIDFDFLYEVEGKPSPTAHISVTNCAENDGVCIASLGLGDLNYIDLRQLKLNSTLIGKLYPYLGRKGAEASNYPSEFPLNLSENEALAIDKALKHELLGKLTIRFNVSSEVLFFDISSAWQSIIFSIELQYGNTQKYCPDFWNFVISEEWDEALTTLYAFGERHGERHKIEADYIISASVS
jgi:hypothetical protein